MSTDPGTSAPVINRDVALNDLDVRGFFGLDDAVRPGFGEVRVSVTLDGPADPDRYRELQRTVNRHCPVLDLCRSPDPDRHRAGRRLSLVDRAEGNPGVSGTGLMTSFRQQRQCPADRPLGGRRRHPVPTRATDVAPTEVLTTRPDQNGSKT